MTSNTRFSFENGRRSLRQISGYMSVSINKAIERESENESADLVDSILFYSGTYRIEGDKIWHHVTNASNPARIGCALIRSAEFN